MSRKRRCQLRARRLARARVVRQAQGGQALPQGVGRPPPSREGKSPTASRRILRRERPGQDHSEPAGQANRPVFSQARDALRGAEGGGAGAILALSRGGAWLGHIRWSGSAPPRRRPWYHRLDRAPSDSGSAEASWWCRLAAGASQSSHHPLPVPPPDGHGRPSSCACGVRE